MREPDVQTIGARRWTRGCGGLGLLLGERALLGIVNIDIVEDIVHLITGGILAYVGFGQRDEGVTRSVVGALGAVYLLVGVLGFVLPSLFGLVTKA